ncbi:HNH endonuclease [Stenotrophomonas sp. NPDC077659]|uniref:HNH endonuclease n=1 Tax=Stenotrophomonas sp. NPDC077659 TaxID=3390694 RepID=UPI003D01B192
MAEVNEYKAAAMVGMSPELLRWLTKYAPKSGDTKKLLKKRVEGEIFYFDAEEVTSFNQWLMEPWPSKDGQRPGIPAGILTEIRVEANGACALCCAYGDTCEAAHIDPVSKSKNNHPGNLIWLCANHHTAFDKGYLGPHPDDQPFVPTLKANLHRAKKANWSVQGDISERLAAIMNACVSLEKDLPVAHTQQQRDALNTIAGRLVGAVKACPVSKADKTYQVFQKLTDGLEQVSSQSVSGQVDSEKLLNVVRQHHEEVKLAAGLVTCPLCEGVGEYNDYDCPVCDSSGAVSEDEEFDLSPFQLVPCKLCQSTGYWDGGDCPVCHGDAKLEQRFSDRVDVREFTEIDCPLCEGGRYYDGNECPVCQGDGKIEARHVQGLDLTSYEIVPCPLCAGHGSWDGENCPVCHGEGQGQSRYFDRVDRRRFEKVNCPLCGGRGVYEGSDCHPCQNSGSVERRDVEHIHLKDYEIVTCRSCGGAGEVNDRRCLNCGGQGEAQRRFFSSR